LWHLTINREADMKHPDARRDSTFAALTEESREDVSAARRRA
jgi:hypothetical protein